MDRGLADLVTQAEAEAFEAPPGPVHADRHPGSPPPPSSLPWAAGHGPE